MFIKRTLEEFTEQVAGKKATPGGGTVAAVSGSMGVALMEMVLSLTIGKKGFEDNEAFLLEKQAALKNIRLRMQVLADEDAAAFDTVMAAFGMPKGNDIEKTTRLSVIQVAYKKAAEVPLETAKSALQAMKIAETLLGKINMNAISDLMMGAVACNGAVTGGLLNTSINLPSIKDENLKKALEEEVEKVKREAEKCFENIKLAVYKEDYFSLLAK